MPTVPDAAAPAIEVSSSVSGPLLQAWPDGRIAWSGDTIRGGSPLQTETIDPEAVAATIRAIRGLLRGEPWTTEVRAGPDADVTTVRVWDGATLLVDVSSWHERFEADPRLVVTASGVEPLNGRSREAVLAQQPAEYRLFRERWDEVLGRLRGLVPARRTGTSLEPGKDRSP
jgi:hypothetical protein